MSIQLKEAVESSFSKLALDLQTTNEYDLSLDKPTRFAALFTVVRYSSSIVAGGLLVTVSTSVSQLVSGASYSLS